MIDGVVSNCWQSLLEKGEALEALLEKAQRRSLRFIELRQGCLGSYESGTQVPDADRLGELAGRFPAMTITLALCVPFMSGDHDVEGELMRAGSESAEALAGEGRAHLRLVDLRPLSGEHSRDVEKRAADKLAPLAARLAENDGVLSLENALHPWEELRSLFHRTRTILGDRRQNLQLCYDPCNMHLPGCRDRGALDVPRDLSAKDLSMVHVKQSREGRLLPVVSDGDVDWKFQLRSLRRIGYGGTILLEIAPSAEVWDEIARSEDYLAQLATWGESG